MADDLLKNEHKAILPVERATETAKQISSDSELSLKDLESVSAGLSSTVTLGMAYTAVGIGRYFKFSDN